MINQRFGRFAAAIVLSALCAIGIPHKVEAGDLAHTAVVSPVPASFTPHLLADATVDRPLALAAAQLGSTMYVGGKFQSVENATRTVSFQRSHLFAFNAATGAVSTSFAPVANQPVFAILPVGNSIYVGGEFGVIGGITRRAIVKLDAVTGAVDLAFNARIPSGRVTEIRLVSGRLFIGGTFPGQLKALNPATGADTGYINLAITGQLPLTNTKTEVYKFAVNSSGTRLVGVGNFTAVAGQNRKRAFMLSLDAGGATLNPWYYLPLERKCVSNSPTLQAYLFDVDFSPDGSYFVFGSTGFVPTTTSEIGSSLCDCVARFETNVANPSLPTWINYTGGDTVQSVISTGAAVYAQGHFRWLDNPFGRDSKGPGAVDRLGIGAINPGTGKALDWNPSAPAAQGGRDFLATPVGLWAMSDSRRFGGKYHRGIAFVPLP